ncbi:MFS transporter [Saccharopolyspora pogona]|uniref:MFS transporter n=1 Tax=Saccharopolyspora pogona TaxID=333966 RepID=UPI0016893609|nr:MFS transporter [Saccharopolyspora pogona]
MTANETGDKVASRPPGEMEGLQREPLRRITLAASIGSGIEYFDLVIYGALATTIATVFFPNSDSTASMLNTFAVFAVAFVARPLGGLFWGPLGDRIGRKRTLSAVILVMATATAAIGLIPGYGSIGTAGPVLLVVLRFIQGISVGGEMPGAATMVAEFSPNNRRALQTSFLQWGVIIGQVGALLSVAALSVALTPGQIEEWGWRIPFLIAFPVGLIGLYIRTRIGETPEFDEVARSGVKVQHPLRALLGSAAGWKGIGRTAMFNLPASVPAYLLLTFLPTFLKSEAGLSSGEALMCVTVAVLVAMLAQPLAGYWSDRLGRRPLLLALCALELALAYPAFSLLLHGDVGLAVLGLVVIGFLHGVATGCQAAPNLESFPTRIRFTGYAVAYGLSTAILAGPTPYVATWLIDVTGNLMAPAWMIMACAVIPLVGAYFVRETANRPLPM